MRKKIICDVDKIFTYFGDRNIDTNKVIHILYVISVTDPVPRDTEYHMAKAVKEIFGPTAWTEKTSLIFTKSSAERNRNLLKLDTETYMEVVKNKYWERLLKTFSYMDDVSDFPKTCPSTYFIDTWKDDDNPEQVTAYNDAIDNVYKKLNLRRKNFDYLI